MKARLAGSLLECAIGSKAQLEAIGQKDTMPTPSSDSSAAKNVKNGKNI